jgi:hypothetical protein
MLGAIGGYLTMNATPRKPTTKADSNDTLNAQETPRANIHLTKEARPPLAQLEKHHTEFNWFEKKEFVMETECVDILNAMQMQATCDSSLDARLPKFDEQLELLTTSIFDSKIPSRPLLIEGLPGIGKGAALRTIAVEEGYKRPALFLALSDVLDTSIDTSHVPIRQDLGNWAGCLAHLLPSYMILDGFGLDEVQENDTDRRQEFRRSIEGILGAQMDPLAKLEEKSSSFSSFDPPAEGFHEDNSQDSIEVPESLELHESPLMEEAVSLQQLRRITKALQQRYYEWESKQSSLLYLPPLLILDDVQILFNGKGHARENKWDDIETTFEWLLKLQVHGLLDLIVCSEGRSVATAFRRLPGFECLKIKTLEGVDDELVASYLVEHVNPIIEDGFKKFSPREAIAFAEAFGGSLLEIEAYLDSDAPNVHTYIGMRQEDYHRLISHILSNHPRFDDLQPDSLRHELQSFILALMMNGGKLSVHGNEHWSKRRWEVVECLLELRLVRWDLNTGRESRSGSRTSLDASAVASTLRTYGAGALSDGASHMDSDDEGTEVDISDLNLMWMTDMIGNAMSRFFNLGM